MAKQPERRFDMTGVKVLQSSLKKMKEGDYIIQVGVFGNKAARKDEQSGLTNAEVGLIHEMGSVERNIPRRSFLWDTFANHSDKLMPELKEPIAKYLKTGKIEQYLKVAGQAASNLVVEAFQTSGFGAWPQNSYRTIMAKLRKGVKDLAKRRQMAAEVMFEGATHTKPLIDTGQLWQAISYRTGKA